MEIFHHSISWWVMLLAYEITKKISKSLDMVSETEK